MQIGPSVALATAENYPTIGPENRYCNILFIEKEGFDPLLTAVRIAERYDLAIMSTKGMSVTAARLLLDRLAPRIYRVFVLHDFDIAGFSIFGTLGADGRRYTFENKVPMVDLGLRLRDVHAMRLARRDCEGQQPAGARRYPSQAWGEVGYYAGLRMGRVGASS